MLLEDCGDGGFDQGGAEAREHRGGAAEDGLVEDLGLGEVGDLGGATDGGLGGQQVILENGAKEGVGTEALGRIVQDRNQLGGRVLGFAGDPELTFAAEGQARAGSFVKKKKQAAERGDEDLGVVTTFLEELVALVECGFKGGSVLDGLAEDGRSKGMEGARGGVDNDEAVVGEGCGDEAGEGGGEGCVGGIGGDEQVEFWRAADQFRGAVEDGGDPCAEGRLPTGCALWG